MTLTGELCGRMLGMPREWRVANRYGRCLLVGLQPGPQSRHSSGETLTGATGRRFMSYCEVHHEERLPEWSTMRLHEYLALFDRVNLYKEWSPALDAEMLDMCWEELEPLALDYDRVVFLGSVTARQAGLTSQPPLRWVRQERGRWWARLPHPSGRNFWWNNLVLASTARMFLHSLVDRLRRDHDGWVELLDEPTWTMGPEELARLQLRVGAGGPRLL